MSNLDELLILLGMLAAAGFWMKQSTARERATREARRQCEYYGVQLLDETVGLRRWRMRRHENRLRLERGYSFEVSLDGADREPGMLWMHDGVLAELHLPTVMLTSPESPGQAFVPPRATAASPIGLPLLPAGSPETPEIPARATDDSNVVPLRPRRRPGDQPLH